MARTDSPNSTRLFGSLLAALLMAVGLANSSVAKSTPSRLMGSNVIKGAHLAGERVRIPKDAWLATRNGFLIEKGPKSHITFKGNGRIVGLALVEEDPDPSDRASLVWFRQSFCGSPGCADSESTPVWTYEHLRREDKRGRVYLPAGTYRLYLLADGAPVEVTLRLGGLRGTATFNPTGPARGAVQTPEVHMSAGEGERAYWFGADADFEGNFGIMYVAMRAKADDWVIGRYGMCSRNSRTMPSELAYSPACPEGDTLNFTSTDIKIPPGQNHVTDGWFHLIESDTPGFFHGQGEHLVASGGIREITGIAFYLDFNIGASR